VEAYRTPDERFVGLPLYPYEPHYFEFQGLRLHHLDEGSGEPILLFHGEPDWSFLYRRMIPALSHSFRVIAPDYLGFGRSDKPLRIEDYSYDLHVESIKALIESLDLRGIRIVVQDWGGPIGLRVATEMKDRMAGLVVLNTGLFSEQNWPTPGFLQWRSFAERVGLDMPVGTIMQRSTQRELDDDTLRGYEAPWPVRESKAGVAAFPLIVPISTEDPGAAAMRNVAQELRSWQVPALVCWSDQDPVFPLEAGRRLAQLLPGAGGEVWAVEGAGHMLQEDRGEDIAERILRWAGAG
jgi:haloalkane dehalogenase